MGERTAGGNGVGVTAPGDAVPAADEALCRAFLAGDEAAFGELLRRHQALVHALVRRYATRPEDARDLAQKAFLRAFEAARRTLPRLSAGGGLPFKAWLARIAVNLGKNHARQASRWRLAPVTALEQTPGSGPSAPEALERTERERQARAAVLALPRRQREVLTLRIDGGLSFQEIGEALGITQNNAKVHFHHAVQKLRTVVTEQDSGERRG
jgi:RNA polymerase sigma-70 factor (ECF subfamily)